MTTIRCDIDLKGGDPHCDIIKRILEDTNESVRLTLNLLHEPGHTPVRSGSRGQQAPSQTEW